MEMSFKSLVVFTKASKSFKMSYINEKTSIYREIILKNLEFFEKASL
jgi:hypothetical protein